MTIWFSTTIRSRQAQIGQDEDGEYVTGEFDFSPLEAMLREEVVNDMIPALLENDDFLEALGESLTGPTAIKMAMDLMEHMTPKEVAAIMERLMPPT